MCATSLRRLLLRLLPTGSVRACVTIFRVQGRKERETTDWRERCVSRYRRCCLSYADRPSILPLISAARNQRSTHFPPITFSLFLPVMIENQCCVFYEPSLSDRIQLAWICMIWWPRLVYEYTSEDHRLKFHRVDICYQQSATKKRKENDEHHRSKRWPVIFFSKKKRRRNQCPQSVIQHRGKLSLHM